MIQLRERIIRICPASVFGSLLLFEGKITMRNEPTRAKSRAEAGSMMINEQEKQPATERDVSQRACVDSPVKETELSSKPDAIAIKAEIDEEIHRAPVCPTRVGVSDEWH